MHPTRAHLIKLGLIHNGPMTYPPGHPIHGNVIGTRRLTAEQLYRTGFPIAADAKRKRAIGEYPTYL